MKITVGIPTTGERPELLEHAKKMIARQTRKPDDVVIVKSTTGVTDGFTKIFNKVKEGILVCWEDDDWYSPTYIEEMVRVGEEIGLPHFWGLNETMYYHIYTHQYSRMMHKTRSGMFSMVINRDEFKNIETPSPEYRFLDLWLWQKYANLGRPIPPPTQDLNIGIKHGQGPFGGAGHNPNIFKFKEKGSAEMLKRLVGEEDFKFYNDLREKHAPSSKEFLRKNS